jgi:uncharacterized metal-binding protein
MTNDKTVSKPQELPLIYSCSGCSNVAQLANRIAVSMDREGSAEMSCISGIGGNVKSIVKKAESGCPIIAIDRCPLVCVKNCLKQHNITAIKHYELTELSNTLEGLAYRKLYKEDCSDADFEKTKDFICNDYRKR